MSSSTKVAKRPPSPSSSASSSSLLHSRSLPSPSKYPAPASSSESGSISTESHRRVFHRSASDRIETRRSAPEAAPLQMEEVDIVSPRKGGQRRRKGPLEESKNPKQSRPRRDLPLDREEIVSPTRRRRNQQNVDARPPGTTNPEAVLAARVSCREDEALRRSCTFPLTVVKAEPEEVETTVPVQAKVASLHLRQRAAGLLASLPSSCFGTSDRNNAGSSPSPSEASPAPSRRSRRERVVVPETCDWSQHITDIVMWRDFPKSSLIFGAGSFAILSSFFMEDMRFNVITLASYLTLVYLSVVFVRKNMMQGGEATCAWELDEATAVEMAKEALPAVNAALLRLSRLFSGDPSITLKVAGILWFLTQAGHCLSLWNFLCLAFVAAFVIPKCYSTYSMQLQNQGNFFLSYLLSTWDNCSHKKVVVLVLLMGFWNLSSVSAKLWMAFVSIVALRRYQMALPTSTEPGCAPPVRVKEF